MLARITEFSIRTRVIVVIGWIAIIIAGLMTTNDLNSRLTTSLTVPNSESAIAEQVLNREFSEKSESLITITYKFGTIPKPEIEVLKSRTSAVVSSISGLSIIEQRPIGGTLFTIASSAKELPVAAFDIDILRSSLKENGLGNAQVSGPPAIYADVKPVLGNDLARGQIIAISAALALLILTLGFSLSVFLPFIFAAASITLTLTILDFLSHYFLMVLYLPSVVELIGFGLAIDYSLLIIHRYRSEAALNPQLAKFDWIEKTLQTAGRTVLISSLTITLALSTLLFIPVPFIRSLGMGGVLVPISSALATLTFVPALLALFGERLRQSYKFHGLLRLGTAPGSLILRFAEQIVRAPKRIFFGTLTLLILFALPIMALQVTPSSLTALPPELESAKAISYISTQAGEGVITPIVIMGEIRNSASVNNSSIDESRLNLAGQLSQLPGVLTVAQGDKAPYVNQSGNYFRIFVFSKNSLGSDETRDLVKQLREKYLPESELSKYVNFYIGGAPAQGVDLIAKILKYLPLIVMGLILVIYLVLLRTFKSILLPLKAIILGAISLAASLGLLVLFMKYGLAKALFGTYQLDQMEIWALVFLVAILFGVSMDYEIFIVSRMREAWLRGEDNESAISEGFVRTLGVVTAAAIIFISAVSGFIFGHFAGLQELGLGLTLAVLIDATLVRALLLPSAMVLLGKWNWWLPK
jgi:RND superfamily putative drug exporter